MASPGGTSSVTSQMQTSGSEEDLQVVVDLKKRKRMISNRESARRSRMRKQKRLDELTEQVIQLRQDKSQLMTTLSLTRQHFFAVDAENSVLRTQMMELSNRLQSLNDILHNMNANNNNNNNSSINNNTFMSSNSNLIYENNSLFTDIFTNPWNLMYLNQPIMASADSIFPY